MSTTFFLIPTVIGGAILTIGTYVFLTTQFTSHAVIKRKINERGYNHEELLSTISESLNGDYLTKEQAYGMLHSENYSIPPTS